uniref:Uncharacterized protein n=1 Tax=Anguilla anguilla TaxID=7936 RepID=A0A0E9RCR8_ANGAN
MLSLQSAFCFVLCTVKLFLSVYYSLSLLQFSPLFELLNYEWIILSWHNQFQPFCRDI